MKWLVMACVTRTRLLLFVLLVATAAAAGEQMADGIEFTLLLLDLLTTNTFISVDEQFFPCSFVWGSNPPPPLPLPPEPWSETNARLSLTLIPSSYELDLFPDLSSPTEADDPEAGSTFTGRVEIQVRSLEPRRDFYLHAKYMEVRIPNRQVL